MNSIQISTQSNLVLKSPYTQAVINLMKSVLLIRSMCHKTQATKRFINMPLPTLYPVSQSY